MTAATKCHWAYSGRADKLIRSVLSLVALAVVTGSPASAVTFSSTDMIVPPNSGQIGAAGFGDVNGDDRPDIVIWEFVPSTLVVKLQQPDGSLANGQTLSITGQVTQVFVTDLNGDGHPDILALAIDPNTFHTTTFAYIGRPDGTVATTPITSDLGKYALNVQALDFSKDGKIDLVGIFEPASDTFDSYRIGDSLGSGDGSFAAATVQVTQFRAMSGFAVADFNHDGILDVAAGTQDMNDVYGLSIYNGTGHGNLKTPVTYSVGAFVTSVAAADLNGDSRPDLIVGLGSTFSASGHDSVGIMLNKGDGTFPFPTAYGTLGGAVTVGDFTGDGISDILCLDGGVLSIIKGNGNGTFSAANTGMCLAPFGTSTVIDFDGDGNRDIAGISAVQISPTASRHDIDLIKGNGDGTFQAPRYAGDAIGVRGIVSSDFNKDGKKDIAMLLPDSVEVALGNGDGAFGAPVYYSTGPANIPDLNVKLLKADINNDGNLDLVVVRDIQTGSGAPLRILLGNGNGTFQPATTAGAFVGDALAGAVGDMDGDGNMDVVLVAGGGSSTLHVLFGDGHGSFPTSRSITGLNEFGQDIVLFDANGDGKPDIAVPDSDESARKVDVILNQGSGAFGSPIAVKLANSEAVHVVADDFNRDGNQDLAVSTQSGMLNVLFGNGDGKFQPAATYPILISSALITGDYNGDGWVDIATSLGTLLNNGDGTFGPIGFIQSGNSVPSSICEGAFNHGSKLDLAMVSPTAGALILLNQPIILRPADISPRPVTTAHASLTIRADYVATGGMDALTYTWSATGPAAAAFSANGTTDAHAATVTFTESGKYIFKCVVTDPNGDTATSTTSPVNVTVP